MNTEMVKVKILRHIGRYEPDSIVEVQTPEADALCTPRTVNAGDGRMDIVQFAIRMTDWDALQKLPRDPSVLYSDEMQALGIKNVVPTPRDEALEARMRALTNKKDLPQEPEELTDSVRDLTAKGRKTIKKAD